MRSYYDEWYVDITETRWGQFTVLAHEVLDDFETKLKMLHMNPNENISYQYHDHRQETWNIMHGTGTMVIDGESFKIKAGDSFIIPQGSWHAVKADDCYLEIAEFQCGKVCSDHDIVRTHYAWSDIMKEVDNNG